MTAMFFILCPGYSSGHVDRYNIQSGIHRGEYTHASHPAHKVNTVGTTYSPGYTGASTRTPHILHTR